MTSKNRAKRLISTALIGKEFKYNNTPSTTVNNNKQETFEALDGERIKSNTTTKRLKKIYGEGKCVKTNSCIINRKCQHKCRDKFTENDRKYIFDTFWKLGNKPRQQNYLVKCVDKVSIKRKQNIISRRSISYKYYLYFISEKKQVCQQFLLTTLDISQKFLLYTIKNLKLGSSEENKNCGKIVSKSKFGDSAQYDDLQEEKTVNSNGPIETIRGNSLSADVSHVSTNCLPLTKKHHNINEVKSFVSKNKSYLDVGQSKNNTRSNIHKLPIVDKNITDISVATFLVNGLLKGEKTQTKKIKIIKQKCILKKNNVKVHIRMNKLKKTFEEGKCVKPNPCVLNKKCHHKSWEKFTDNDRKNIFDMFWKLGSIQRKRTKIDDSRRSVTYKYYLSYMSEKKLVCQQLLLTTLDITQRFLIYNIEKCFQSNSEKNNDCKMTIFKNQFENSAIFKVYQFINKLPALSSRYCSASNKKYLPAEIVNVIQLYNLYKDYCKMNKDEPVSKYIFENIFKKQTHLGFHVSKRKKCNLCVAFKNTNSPNCELEIQKSHMKDWDECKDLVISHRQITDPSTKIISNAKFNNLTKLCKDGIIPKKFHKEYLDMKPDENVKDCLNQTDVEDEDDEKSFIGWL